MQKLGKFLVFAAVFSGLAAIVFAGYSSSKRSRHPRHSGHGHSQHGHGHGHSDGCPRYEEISQCFNPCSNRSCENLMRDPSLPCPRYCQSGICDCIEDFRRLNGKCVPEDQCPQSCPPNEAMSSCYNPCFERSCENLNQNSTVCPLYCLAGRCDCIDGYRRLNGTCVPEDQCPQSCPPNEAISPCLSPCTERSCENLDRNITICPFFCIANKCDCIDGWRRLNGTCVPEDQCPQFCPQPNEAISPCRGACTDRTCENLNPRPNPRLTCPHICVRGECDCKLGYRRLDTGECVPEDQCPNWCPKPNEVKWDCFNECSPRTCPNVTQIRVPPCTSECRVDCDCINGCLRNECGVCVPEAQCADPCSCASDQEEIACINSCTARTCEHATSGVFLNCDLNVCSKTCECKIDFARDANQVCVPEYECCV